MKLILAVLCVLLLSACTLSFEETRARSPHYKASASPSPDRMRCRSLDSERAWAGVGAAFFGACTAGTGIPSIIEVVSDKDSRTGLQVVAAVCGITAAGLVVLRDSAGGRWVADGCGQ